MGTELGLGLGHDQGEHRKPICFSLIDLLSDPLLWLGLERAWRKPPQRRGGGVGAGGDAVLWCPSCSPFWAGNFGFIFCSKATGCSPLVLSLSPTFLGRFDSNASASSSSNEGDSDREEKKRKQLKKAKMAKDRKSRKKPVEVRPLNGGWGCWGATLCSFHTSRGWSSWGCFCSQWL